MAERWQWLEKRVNEKWKQRWEERTTMLLSVIRSRYWSEEREEDRLKGGGKEAAPGFGPQLSGDFSSVPVATSWPRLSGDTSKGLISPSVRNAHINACTHVQQAFEKCKRWLHHFPFCFSVRHAWMGADGPQPSFGKEVKHLSFRSVLYSDV